MALRNYNDSIADAVLRGSKWECLLHFWRTNPVLSEQWLVFGPRVDPAGLLRMARRTPDLYLLAAVVENRVLKRAALQEMAAARPTLESARAELSAVLQAPAGKAAALLAANPAALSASLTQYVKDRSDTVEPSP